MGDPAFVAGLKAVPTGNLDSPAGRRAHDVVGVTPAGAPAQLRIAGFGSPLLLAFLHTSCDGCDEFWRGFAAPEGAAPFGVSTAVVTKGPDSVDPAEVGRAAQGVDRLPVVMSDRAWVDYRVMGYPFFVLVDTSSCIVIAETVGFGWADVTAMIRSSGH